MTKKVIAASLVAVWLALFSFELVNGARLYRPGRSELPGSVQTTLIQLTRAEISDDQMDREPDQLCGWPGPSVALSLRLVASLESPKLVKTPSHLYDLHETLRL